jgi:glycosyltransferase involved in cell wall biosynthesis
MNILLIHQYFLEADDPGGSRFNEMTRIWTEKGHHVTVIAGMMHYNGALKKDKYKWKFFIKHNQNGVQVIRTHVSEKYNKNFLGRFWAYLTFMISSVFVGVFYLNKKFDLVLVTSPPLFVGITGFLISRVKKIPLVFEVRDLWPDAAIELGILKNKTLTKWAFALESFIYKKSSLINVLTPAFKEFIIEKKGVSANKVIVISNGADFHLTQDLYQNFDFTSLRNQLGWNDKFVIIYTGAHGVANHLEQVFEVAEQLKETNVLFVFFGMGMRKPFLLEEKERRKIENVKFYEPVSKKEVFKYILAADMGLCLFKKGDIFKTIYANKTFDYLACGKPILMGIDGASKAFIETAKAGTFFYPESTESFETAVKVYLNNPAKVKIEGLNGLLYVKKNYQREALAETYLKFMQQIVK